MGDYQKDPAARQTRPRRGTIVRRGEDKAPSLSDVGGMTEFLLSAGGGLSLGQTPGAPVAPLPMPPVMGPLTKNMSKEAAREKKKAIQEKKSEMKRIAKERKAADKADLNLRGTPYERKGNKRGFVRGLVNVADKVEGWKNMPARMLEESHLKALDDLNLNRRAYRRLGVTTRTMHVLKNPLAHLRSGKSTLQGSLRRHMQEDVSRRIEAVGLQRELGTSKYSGRNLVDFKHVDREELEAREEARREAARQAYLQERSRGVPDPTAPAGELPVWQPRGVSLGGPEQRAAAAEKRSRRIREALEKKSARSLETTKAGSGESREAALKAGSVLRELKIPDMIVRGDGPPDAKTDYLGIAKTGVGIGGSVVGGTGKAAEKLGSVAQRVGGMVTDAGELDFAGGMQKGLEKVAPVLDKLGAGIGEGLHQVAPYLNKIDPDMEEQLSVLAPHLNRMGSGLKDKVTPYVPLVGGGLGQGLRRIAPDVERIGTGIKSGTDKAAPFLKSAGPVGGIGGELVNTYRNVKQLKKMSDQGDIAGSLRSGFKTGGNLLKTAGKTTSVVGNFVPAVGGVMGPVGKAVSLGVNIMNVGEGMVQGVQGSLTDKHAASLLDQREYDRRRGKAVSERERSVLRSAAQMRRQATVEQIAGYTKAAGSGLKAAGDVASLTGPVTQGIGELAGTALSVTGSGVELVGGLVADSKLGDVQHTVANQEIELDQAVNARLRERFGPREWRGMTDRQREQARKREEKTQLYYHGQSRGDLEQFTIGESRKRARGLVETAGRDTDEGRLAEGLIRGAGLRKAKGGGYSEQAVGRKLYSRGGKDLDEAYDKRERKLGSEIQRKFRAKEEKDAEKAKEQEQKDLRVKTAAEEKRALKERAAQRTQQLAAEKAKQRALRQAPRVTASPPAVVRRRRGAVIGPVPQLAAEQAPQQTAGQALQQQLAVQAAQRAKRMALVRQAMEARKAIG